MVPRDYPIKSWLAKPDVMKERPSAAKAAYMAGSNGMAEAMPLQSYPGNQLDRFP
jgi:hypothetical protein